MLFTVSTCRSVFVLRAVWTLFYYWTIRSVWNKHLLTGK